jgi:hypothetical protein
MRGSLSFPVSTKSHILGIHAWKAIEGVLKQGVSQESFGKDLF